MKIKVISKTKSTTDSRASQTIEVSQEIFGQKANPNLTTQAVLCQLANRRRVIASTKDRGEVSGGGRKPFRQKGTGRARAGSTRSPIWIGGGITFGPKNLRNFSKRLNKKMLKQSLASALSEKVKNNRLIVVDEFKFSKIATREVQSYLEKLPIEEGRILIVLAKTNPALELSVGNLAYAKTILVQNLNIVDLLKFDYLLTDKAGIAQIEKIFLKINVRSKE